MFRANDDIRRAASAAGVMLWEVANSYGCADTTLSRKLRYELPDNEKDKLLQIIKEIACDKQKKVTMLTLK